MKKLLTNNLGLKLLSIVAAVMLWLIVMDLDDPVKYKDFSPIRVTMLNEDAVTGKDKVYKIEDNSDIISVRVWAKTSILQKLDEEDFTATADMEKNIKYGNLVGIEVTCSNKDVKSADIIKSRENVVISVEDASSEQFNVTVNKTGQEGAGYMVGTAVPEQSLIQISGPSSIIAKIKRVQANLNVTGFTTDQTRICKLEIIGTDEQPLTEEEKAYLDYAGKTEGMKVTVSMLKTKTVPVKIGHTGTPAEGYSFAGISYKPETLEIAGTEEAIAQISDIVIPDEAVNVEGMTETMQQELNVTEYLPAGIRLRNETDGVLAVMVEIEKKQGKTVRISVSDIGLSHVPRGYEVDFGDVEEIELIVMGTTAELAELNEEEIAVTLDLKGYTKAGTYTETLEITLPGDFSLMEDVEIEFALSRAAGDTNAGGTAAGKPEDSDSNKGEGSDTGKPEGSDTDKPEDSGNDKPGDSEGGKGTENGGSNAE